jgi:hypothetical protein
MPFSGGDVVPLGVHFSEMYRLKNFYIDIYLYFGYAIFQKSDLTRQCWEYAP